MRVGITGHMNLTRDTESLVRDAIGKVLGQYVPEGLTGVSCAAAGADTVFAEVVLDLGGELEVILPAADYRERKVGPDHVDRFDSVVRRAAAVRVMPFDVSDRDAYEGANEALLEGVDHLLAVWDGQAAADKGGTATVVSRAAALGLPVEVVWPEGARRA
jgi:hypothetical protein